MGYLTIHKWSNMILTKKLHKVFEPYDSTTSTLIKKKGGSELKLVYRNMKF